MRPGVSSMIPKQNDKAWNGARQAFQDTKNFDFKSQEKSDVDHILRVSESFTNN
jgi:hypothetical protein